MHHLTCAYCANAFTAQRATALYCSTACKHNAKYHRRKDSATRAAYLERKYARDRKTDRASKYAPDAQCTDAECDRTPTHRGMCKMHYRRVARANGLEQSPSSAWNDSRKRHNAKRKAIMRGATEADVVDKRKVYERDNWTCGICLHPVDSTLTYPHPMSASLDHIQALANGGAHTYANAQCGHLLCNQRKGAKQVALIV